MTTVFIYRIYHRESGKSYIGQSTQASFKHRYSGGRWWSETQNPILLAAAHKYGVDAFSVDILKSNVESVEQLNALEELFAKQFNSYHPNGYNLALCGANRKMLSHGRERVRQLKSKPFRFRKIDTWEIVEGVNLKGFCREHGLSVNPLQKVLRGKGVTSQGYCGVERTRDELETYRLRCNPESELLGPDGTRYPVTNPKRFAREHGLSESCVLGLMNGSRFTYRGFRLAENADAPTPRDRSFKLRSPSGEIHQGVLLRKFCQEKGLIYNQVLEVLRGALLQHRGWHLSSTSDEQLIMRGRRQVLTGKLIDPSGTTHEVANLRVFCAQHGLPYNRFYWMVRGRNAMCLGWTMEGTTRSPRFFCAPDGSIHETTYLTAFAKTHGLSYRKLTEMKPGDGKSCQGWVAILDATVQRELSSQLSGSK